MRACEYDYGAMIGLTSVHKRRGDIVLILLVLFLHYLFNPYNLKTHHALIIFTQMKFGHIGAEMRADNWQLSDNSQFHSVKLPSTKTSDHSRTSFSPTQRTLTDLYLVLRDLVNDAIYSLRTSLLDETISYLKGGQADTANSLTHISINGSILTHKSPTNWLYTMSTHVLMNRKRCLRK